MDFRSLSSLDTLVVCPHQHHLLRCHLHAHSAPRCDGDGWRFRADRLNSTLVFERVVVGESIRYGLMRDYGLKSYGLTRYLDALVVPLSQDLAESVLLLRPNGSTGTSHP